jgi:hypothetical protein
VNVPKMLATVVSRGLSTLHELDTVYSTQDLYDMLEIIAVDSHNQYILNKPKG